MDAISAPKGIDAIAIVSDSYPPSTSSAAIQLKDLAIEFLSQGISPTVITADSEIKTNFCTEYLDGVRIIRLKTAKFRDVSTLRRAMAEFIMPILMVKNFKMANYGGLKFDAVVWYSPSIFLGPFVYFLKRSYVCPTYLILRDIFPAWALDLRLIKKGFFYYLLKGFEKFQYYIADFIGIQAFGNLGYFNTWSLEKRKKIEVLQNWLYPKLMGPCSIDLANSPIANRKIFIYAGNMGIAQGIYSLLDLAQSLLDRGDIGFLFVGRGSESENLKLEANKRGLINTVFYDEINSDEIPGLYAQCHIGLISLDLRHLTHNIPGKFLSYLQSGLPVLAIINQGNDLQYLIEEHQIGRVALDCDEENLKLLAHSLIDEISHPDCEIKDRCKTLADKMFSPRTAVNQIIVALESKK